MLSPEPGAQLGKERGFCRACTLLREPRFFLLLAAYCHERTEMQKRQNFQETPKIQILFLRPGCGGVGGWGGSGGGGMCNFLILPCFPPNPDLKNNIMEVQTKHIFRTEVAAEESIFRLLKSS